MSGPVADFFTLDKGKHDLILIYYRRDHSARVYVNVTRFQVFTVMAKISKTVIYTL